jgi:hypothetical protein
MNCERCGNGSRAWATWLVGVALLFGLAIEVNADPIVIEGIVLDGEMPAAGAVVRLQDERTRRFRETVTDDDGRFELARPEGATPGQSMLWAESGDGKVSKLIVGRGHKSEMPYQLELGKPAVCWGEVRDPNGRPVAGATITVAPALATGWRKKTVSDVMGRYLLEAPPCPEGYWVKASAPGYHERLSRNDYTESMSELAGLYPIVVYPMHRIRGVVVGPDEQPAAGCLVSVPADWTPMDGDVFSTATTDAAGAFELQTGYAKWLDIHVKAERYGELKVSIKSLEDPELELPLRIRMPGAVQVRGRVTDSKGRGLEGIRVADEAHRRKRATVTDAEGGFDLGWVPLPQRSDTLEICILAPRPGRPPGSVQFASWDPKTHEFRPYRFQEEPVDRSRPYYLHQWIYRRPNPGEVVELAVKLFPSKLLMVSGTVRDEAGKPEAGAHVGLYAGDPPESEWRQWLYPGARIHLGRHVLNPYDAGQLLLASTETDKEGTYTLTIVRETPASLKVLEWGGGAGLGDDAFSLAVGRSYLQCGLRRGLKIPYGETEMTVDLTLPAPPDEEALERGPDGSIGVIDPATGHLINPNYP